MKVSSHLEVALREPLGHAHALIAAAQDVQSDEYRTASAAVEKWPPSLRIAFDSGRLDYLTSYSTEVAPTGGWSVAVERPDGPTLLLVLASSHRDGFLRERATRVLGERAGALASAALAVRTVDHVSQVRDVARRALSSRLGSADAVVVVPILLALRRRQAGVHAFDDYLELLSQDVWRALVKSSDTGTRRLAIERGEWSAPEFVRIAAADGDPHARLDAARRALAQDEAVSSELLDVRAATVRAVAVAAAPEGVVRPRLDGLLLDRSALLRRSAQARATLLGVDPAAVYRSRLPARTAVLGLGETGADDDAARVTPLLGSGQPAAVRRAAVRALGWLAPRDVVLAVFPPLVEADEPSVAREAGRQLRRIGYRVTCRDLDRALASPFSWTRSEALRMAIGQPGWGVPVAALALYDDPDERLREHARVVLGEWLFRRAPSAGHPTDEQEGQLRAMFDRTDFSSPELERHLRFHAGL